MRGTAGCARTRAASAPSPGATATWAGRAAPPRRWSGSTRPKSSGATGCATAGSPTIPGGSTCSARRSSSRASPTPRPGRSSRPRPPRCRRRPAASATGTTASAGSATRPSASGRCTRSASTRRRATSCASSSASARDNPDLQIMYGIGGEKELTEKTLDHLSGYGGASRCGSATAPTTSARTTSGARCSTRSTCTKKRCAARGTQADRELIRYQVEAAIEAWPHPDQGIWESRGQPQHYVSSKLMIWVAVDRGARLARELGFEEVAGRVGGEGGRDQGRDPRARRPRRDLPPALRHRRPRRLAAADPAAALPPPRRPADPRHRRRDRRRADRARPGPPLQGRGDRRRAQRQGGDLPDLLLLAGLGALGDRRARARARSSASGCWRRPAGSTSSPRSWRPSPAATSATSPRPSPTWR